MGDFNVDLLKCETSHFSHKFLLHLQSCYLIATVDKPTRVHRASVTLIDMTFSLITQTKFLLVVILLRILATIFHKFVL